MPEDYLVVDIHHHYLPGEIIDTAGIGDGMDFSAKSRNRPAAYRIKNGGKTPRELEQLGLDKAFEEIFGKLYFDMAGFAGWMPIVHTAFLTVRTDRLCFGTDYPLDFHGTEDIKTYIDNIKQLDIPEIDKRRILGENAQKLFRLNQKKFR